jgi:hypothetical protein
MSKDKKRRKKIINSTTTELPKKAVALHALPRPRDRYRGTRATIVQEVGFVLRCSFSPLLDPRLGRFW